MTMLAFDTLKLARRLREAGMPQAQAEAVAEAEAEALSELVESRLATKDDIAALRQEIAGLRAWAEGEFAGLRQEMAHLRADLEGTIRRMVMWNIGTMIALVAAVRLMS